MLSAVYEIDPLADTIIILKNPCRNFAPWGETLAPSDTEISEPEEKQPIRAQASEDEWAGRKLSKKGKKGRMRARASRNSTARSILGGDGERAEPSNTDLSGELGPVQDPESAPRVDDGIEDPSAESAEPVSETTESENDEIHYLVSSRHLMLASPWFRRTLTREGSTEALKDPSDGRHHIPASDWDEKALLILLNIFHLRTRQAPATVSLEMLAKIAVLVDYYELEGAEVMERDTGNWIADVRRSVAIPSSYCRELMLWICISRWFHMSKEFEEATAVAIKESQGRFQTLNLPIYQKITSEIDRSRCDALEHIISELHRLLEDYRDFNYSCPNNTSYSFQCGAFLFGALMKHMQRWGYLSPRPEYPFKGMSLNGVCNWGGRSGYSTWWHRGSGHSRYSGYRDEQYEAHSCSLDSKINGVVQNAIAEVKGLKLQDFEKTSRVPFEG